MARRRSLLIVTPALADANNGNWQTARRWARMLGKAYRVRLAPRWSTGDESADALVALHARRSASSIADWAAARQGGSLVPGAPLVVVLTGTDLYRDIDTDAAAQRSLALADALIVLNALGAQRLDARARVKCHTVLQSCSARQTLDKPAGHLRALMVGHLREEKDPLTYLAAAQQLVHRPDLRLDHIGRALDPALGAQAQALQARHPRYRWLGGLDHLATRRRIQAAHLLVHPSRMEGGAHVVIEALRSGTPVLASRIDGNVGLLGDDWQGYFPAGDAMALSLLLERARDDADMLPALRRQAASLAGAYAPEAEALALRRIVAGLFGDDF
ncbi:MAG: selenoneine biosynthesis selenosugar synthase SenB [Rubrivivax sp.]